MNKASKILGTTASITTQYAQSQLSQMNPLPPSGKAGKILGVPAENLAQIQANVHLQHHRAASAERTPGQRQTEWSPARASATGDGTKTLPLLQHHTLQGNVSRRP